MADSKFSDLPAASSGAGTDQFAVNQGGTSKRLTLAQVGDVFIGSGAAGDLVILDSDGNIAVAATGVATYVGGVLRIPKLLVSASGSVVLADLYNTDTGAQDILLQFKTDFASLSNADNIAGQILFSPDLVSGSRLVINTTSAAGALQASLRLANVDSHVTGYGGGGIKLRASGDDIGSTTLQIRNATGFSGVRIENESAELADLIFKGSGADVRHIRYESRAGLVIVADPEFQIGLVGDPTLVISDDVCHFPKGKVLFAGEVEFDADLNHDGSNVGFYGTAPVAQPASGSDLTNNVTPGGTDDQVDTWSNLSTYATDAAAIRDAVFQLARTVKQDHDALRALGLLT